MFELMGKRYLQFYIQILFYLDCFSGEKTEKNIVF